VQPRALTRAARDEIRTLLGDSTMSGGRLAEAIRRLGERHGIEPFRACLGSIAGIDRGEPAARRAILAVEYHRFVLSRRLGRDPGIVIAAIDYLERTGDAPRDPLARREPSGAAAPEPLRPALALQIRRCERWRRPLALAVLRPDRPGSGRARRLAAAMTALRAAVRDVDQVVRILPEGCAVILPCTSGRGGMVAAERARALLTEIAGAPWSAGIASCPEHPWEAASLGSRSQEALARARLQGGGRSEWNHPERRTSRRRPIEAGGLRAALRGGELRGDVAIDDLSIEGAGLRAAGRLPREARVTLALRGTSARARDASLQARVVRADPAAGEGQAGWSIGLRFLDREAARGRVAGLFADLPPERRP
jgi:hypothetical protein